MKGIILAGGSGTRLYPLTLAASKQLLPVYDKPMIYYPLSMLMLAGIRDILVISTPQDTPSFKRLLGDGSSFGAHIQYAVQEKPNGLPQAFIIGEKFIGDDSVCLLLGDNIFYGGGMRKRLLDAKKQGEKGKATIFGYYVNDPKRYGIAKFNDKLQVEEVVEKPVNPPSNYAITGMYFFDNRSVQFSKNCKPSARGETEILDVVRQYLNAGDLSIDLLGRGFTWFDTGTHDSLLDAAEFVRMIETRQGIQLSCLEEIAYINGWINKDALLIAADKMGHSAYGQHLRNVAEGKIIY
jgi:glucose-1-phosphate thymidylyltransferase